MIRVFIADDADDIREVVAALISSSRIEVVGEAATPDETLSEVTRLQPDLVVLDQDFRADITGMELAPLIKKASPATKVLLFTAFDRLEFPDDGSLDAVALKTDIAKLEHTIFSIFD